MSGDNNQPGSADSNPDSDSSPNPDERSSDGGPTIAKGGSQPTRAEGQVTAESDSGLLLWIRDGGVGVALVLLGLLLLTAAAGVWPPMTVVESGSMEPNINQGDMTIVSSPDRFVNQYADEHGVVTRESAVEVGAQNLGGYGSVIVFRDPSIGGPDTIHRAMFYVEQGENWFDRGNESFLHGAMSCSELRNCPAPNAGYITKGDNNPYYDQAIGLSRPVAVEWVDSVARVEIPYLGWIRLIFSGRIFM